MYFKLSDIEKYEEARQKCISHRQSSTDDRTRVFQDSSEDDSDKSQTHPVEPSQISLMPIDYMGFGLVRVIKAFY